MELIVQPEDGLAPLVTAVKQAKTRIDLAIFRFDVSDLEKALQAAIGRGVVVRALVAHTNKKGAKKLRQLYGRSFATGAGKSGSSSKSPKWSVVSSGHSKQTGR